MPQLTNFYSNTISVFLKVKKASVTEAFLTFYLLTIDDYQNGISSSKPSSTTDAAGFFDSFDEYELLDDCDCAGA